MFGAFGEFLSDCAVALIGDHTEEPHTKEALVNKEIKAMEQIKSETDPVIKQRMMMYYINHNYDFSNIRNI